MSRTARVIRRWTSRANLWINAVRLHAQLVQDSKVASGIFDVRREPIERPLRLGGSGSLSLGAPFLLSLMRHQLEFPLLRRRTSCDRACVSVAGA